MWVRYVKGPVQCESLVHGNKYVFGLIDVKSKFLIQYFIKTKDEVFRCFQLFYDEFIPLVRDRNRATNMGVITIISDQGEFNSNEINNFCNTKGLRHITTCAYSPEQNAIIERTWRTISEGAIALLISAHLSEPYWEVARDIVGYIKNRIVGGYPSVDPITPYEKFYGTKPHIRHFKVFGVWAYVLIPNKVKDHRPKAHQGIFVGYTDEIIGGYKVYLPQTNEFVVTAHARFGLSANRTTSDFESGVSVDPVALGKVLMKPDSLSSMCTKVLNKEVTPSIMSNANDLSPSLCKQVSPVPDCTVSASTSNRDVIRDVNPPECHGEIEQICPQSDDSDNQSQCSPDTRNRKCPRRSSSGNGTDHPSLSKSIRIRKSKSKSKSKNGAPSKSTREVCTQSNSTSKSCSRKVVVRPVRSCKDLVGPVSHRGPVNPKGVNRKRCL
jgi:hypothetical protein